MCRGPGVKPKGLQNVVTDTARTEWPDIFIHCKVSGIELENNQANNIWKLGLLEANLAQCLLLESQKIRVQQEKDNVLY